MSDAMLTPRPCHTLTMPFFSRPQHNTAVERRPVGYLPEFGFFRLPREVPRSLLSEAYQSSSQRFIRTTVKSCSSDFHEGHGTVGAERGSGMACVNGRAMAYCLRHYATNRQVAGSIPDGITGIFQ